MEKPSTTFKHNLFSIHNYCWVETEGGKVSKKQMAKDGQNILRSSKFDNISNL